MKWQREEHLNRMAEMHVSGMKQKEMAAHFGISQSQVSRDLKEIYRRWKEPDPITLREHKARHLAKVSALETQLWEAFERSQGPLETEYKEQVIADKEAGVNEDGTPRITSRQKRTKESLRRQTQYGSAALGGRVLDCMKEQAKVLGLYDVKPADTKAPEQIRVITARSAEPRKVPAPLQEATDSWVI
jgi:hypothetical protein